VESNFASSYGGGIYCENGSNPSVEHCTISRNIAGIEGDGIYTTDNSWPTISHSNIYLNGTGVYNDDNSQMLDCPNNWWGDVSGPYHPNYNPGGLGDSVNAFVYPLPFLTEPDPTAPPSAVPRHDFPAPATFTLFPNYPNPFNPTTNIAFELPVMSKVSLKVFNILGQEIETLFDKQIMSSGRHKVRFSHPDLSSGVYFYQLSSGQNTAVGKMVLMK
jgi:parallel beta-helix repeat protein